MGVFIPLLAIFFGGLMMISRTPLGHALARRIGGEVSSEEAEERIAQLEQDMAGLREQLMETQERVDFAERMLAQVREGQRLPPPSS